jgi:hypothetical protein
MTPAALLLAIGTICFAPNERYTACVQYAADGQVSEIAVKPDRIDRVETLTAAEYASLRATFEKMRPLGVRTVLPFPFYAASEGFLFDEEVRQQGTVEITMTSPENVVAFTIRYCSPIDR